jgi:hypothetical protein
MRLLKKAIVIISILLSNNFVKAQDENQLPLPPKGKKWIKVASVSDEFNGTQLDTGKWMPKHPYWEGRDSKHTESNVSVKGGDLRLLSTLRDSVADVNSKTITAACVTSNVPGCHYGYYESRIKCSNISMTSAFWFQGKYSEIDVVENIGKATNPESRWIENTMMINTHFFKKGWKKDRATPVKWEMPGDAGSDYHVYGVWWKNKKSCSFYHNGEKVADVKFKGQFAEKQYMFFDTEVFTWHGWPTRESLLDSSRNTMLIDWVRSWQLVDE